MQFPVQKLYSWAPVCGRDTWDNPGWCSRDTQYCACNKGQGGSATHFGKTSLCPRVGGVGDTANLSADKLSVTLTFPNFSHFTTFQKAGDIRKKRKKPHTVPPPSGGLRPASTRFWQAGYWQPQRPIFLFLCCCFKSKARLVMWKHNNTNTLTLLGKPREGAKAFRWGLCPPSSPMEWSLVEKLWWGVTRKCRWLPDICHRARPLPRSASGAWVQKDAPTRARLEEPQDASSCQQSRCGLMCKTTHHFLSS